MELVLFCILLLVCALAMIEERLRKYNLAVYITLGIVLILFAGLREIGFDKDSENYEIYFYHYDDPGMELTVEYSFRFLSRIFYSLFGDVRSIFLFYALVGVSLKMFALRRLSEFWFLPICVYISYFYIVHDLTQIRASVVSGLTLLAIPYICERKRKTALAILLAGCLFHYSAIALLPILFLSSADMDMKHRVAWACLLPLGFLLHFLPFDIFTAIEIPYITDKIVAYEDLRDKGIIGEEVNVFNLVFLVKCAIYIYILYFYDIIKPNFKYLSLAVTPCHEFSRQRFVWHRGNTRYRVPMLYHTPKMGGKIAGDKYCHHIIRDLRIRPRSLKHYISGGFSTVRKSILAQ